MFYGHGGINIGEFCETIERRIRGKFTIDEGEREREREREMRVVSWRIKMLNVHRGIIEKRQLNLKYQ